MPTAFSINPAHAIAENIYQTSINGLFYINYNFHGDNRGFFAETAIIPDLNALLSTPFAPKQINLARSEQNVARGFHAEPWNKLITVVSGTAFCAIADIRVNSDQYGQVETFELGDSGLRGCLYIPKGLANGYCVTEGPVNYAYVVDELYRDRTGDADKSISLFDENLNVTWPIAKDQMIISDRDQQGITLADIV